MKNVRFAMKPLGYWNFEKNTNLQNFLEKFAKDKSLSPLDPATWYSLAPEISKQKVC